ncbi:MAG: MEDS domain-containing protein [Bacillota bacterium]
MRQQTTDFGLSCLGQVPWGTHVCHFYENSSEALEVAVPYVRSGLRQQEACVWVCASREDADDACHALEGAVPDLSRRLETDQISVLTYDEWYVDRHGRFDSDRVLRQWSERLTGAISAGFRGLRVVGDTSWLDESQWPLFNEYEARLYGSIGHDPMLALCLYPRFGAWMPDPVEVAKSHQYALLRREPALLAIECGKHWDGMWMSLLEGLSDGLLVVDGDGAIRAASSGLLDLFAAKSLRDLGSNLTQFSRRYGFVRDSGAYSPDLSVVLSGTRHTQCWRATTPVTGGEIYLSVRARQMPSSPLTSRRFALVFEDVTEARRAQLTKDRLVHFMSHEFRNPLQVMKTVMTLLEDARRTGGIPDRYVNTLKGQIDHLSSLVDDALTVGRIEDGRMVGHMAETDLVRLVSGWLDSCVSSPAHELVETFSRSTHIQVRVDAVWVRQILSNMLGNAIKYTPAGRRIFVGIRKGVDHVVVSVEDEGIGIPAGELAMVFEPFYRASNSDGAASGAGLGLYISRELARLQGGDMWAAVRPECGAIVNLRLPLH